MADPAQPLDRPSPNVEALVAEHGAVLFRYAYRLSGSSADAEDLTQQVFLTAIQKLDQLREPAAARAWLCAVLRRAYLRRRRKPQPSSNFEIDVELVADNIPDDLNFDGERLQRAIDELPDDFKLVLVGFYFEDCSYKELAERLQLPIGTVMSRLSRAKSFLRAQLVEPEQSEAADAQKSMIDPQNNVHEPKAPHRTSRSRGVAR
jgi:RNA polymerase sigma-70 factor (ECF subfamily)